MTEVVKKVVVPKGLVSELDWETSGYLVRYRIVSQNKNTRSYWSPIYSIPVDFSDNHTLGKTNTIPINLDALVPLYEVVHNWNLTIDFRRDKTYNFAFYDVFLEEGEAPLEPTSKDFVWIGRTSESSFRLILPESERFKRVIVQAASNKQIYKKEFVIFDSALDQIISVGIPTPE